MNTKRFRTLVFVGACVLIAEVTLLTLPQRGGGGFGGVAGPAGAGNNRGAAGQPAPPGVLPSGTTSISGVVLSSHDRTPIESVEIQATGGAGGIATVLTDASGRFTFKDIAIGSYRLRAQRNGFFGPLANGNTAPMVTTQVATSAAQPDATVEILLLAGSGVTGRVTDSTGKPVADARVSVVRLRYAGSETSIAAPANAVTDAAGNYRIFGVEPGEHYLRAAVRRSAAGATIPQTVTYFPSGRDYSEGTLLPASPGSEVIANIQLVEGTRRVVSGRLISPDPTAVATVTFVFVPHGPAAIDNMEASALQRSSGAAGTFQLETMRPGVYDLFAFTTQGSLSGRASVDLRNQDASGITITLAPTVDLDVSFAGEGADSYTRAGMALATVGTTLPAAFRPRSAAGFGGRGQTSQTFTNVVEGKYSLVTSSLGNAPTYVADIVQNGKSLLDDGVITVGKEKPAPVEVRIANGGGVIQGNIQLPAGTMPSSPVTLVAVPEGPRRQNSLLYARMQLAPIRFRGPLPSTFQIRGMTPGRYKVFAFASSPTPYAEQNAEFMKPYEQSGVSVDVALNTPSANITVPLIMKN
jgi:hypothetical protein